MGRDNNYNIIMELCMQIIEYIERVEKRLGRRVGVGFVGLGISNIALLDALYPMRARIALRQDTHIDSALIEKYQPYRVYAGGHIYDDIDEDILFLSPSVRRDIEPLESAEARGCILTSDAELFLSDTAGVYLVTGSDGKSTTATIARALLGQKLDTGLCGNIGTPFAKVGSHERYIAEISSFQAMYITGDIERAVLTSLSPNHLNWHSTLEEYKEAKLALIRRAGYSAVSSDTEMCRDYLSGAHPDTIYSVKYDCNYLKTSYTAKNYITVDGDNILLSGEPIASLGGRRFLRYNLANLLGAISLCLGEIDRGDIGRIIENMPSLRHRAELIHTRCGIDFINSSIDTTPERTRTTLTALDRPVSIIIGGRGKGLSITPVIQTLAKYAVRISLYGEAGAEYYRELIGSPLLCSIPCRLFEAFDDAAEYAIEGGTPDVAVLLSPMATGYGEFRDFAERGEHFIRLIKGKYNS